MNYIGLKNFKCLFSVIIFTLIISTNVWAEEKFDKNILSNAFYCLAESMEVCVVKLKEFKCTGFWAKRDLKDVAGINRYHTSMMYLHALSKEMYEVIKSLSHEEQRLCQLFLNQILPIMQDGDVALQKKCNYFKEYAEKIKKADSYEEIKLLIQNFKGPRELLIQAIEEEEKENKKYTSEKTEEKESFVGKMGPLIFIVIGICGIQYCAYKGYLKNPNKYYN